MRLGRNAAALKTFDTRKIVRERLRRIAVEGTRTGDISCVYK